jgi:hypothetical protein
VRLDASTALNVGVVIIRWNDNYNANDLVPKYVVDLKATLFTNIDERYY